MDVWKKHQASEWKAFDLYHVKIRIKDIVGGKPASPEIIEKWVDATNKEKQQDERNRIKQAHIETLPELVDEKAEKQMNVFARVDGELCIEGRQVKAMMKEAGNIIKTIAPGGPIAALKSKIADQTFVIEEYISLGRSEPDSIEDHPIHVITAQGPRTSIKRIEIVKNAEIAFTVKKKIGRDKSSVSEKALLAVLDYGQSIGLGAERSRGHGLFEILSVEKTDQIT